MIKWESTDSIHIIEEYICICLYTQKVSRKESQRGLLLKRELEAEGLEQEGDFLYTV